MESGVHKVEDQYVQMIVEQATTAQAVRDQDAALASTQRQQLYQQTRSVLFVMQASIIRQQLSHRILAQTVA